MDIAAPDDRLAASTSHRTPIERILLELLGTVMVLGAIGTLFFNWLGVYLVFFGETPEVTRESVITYQVAVAAGILGTVLAVLGSAWRNGGRPGRTVWWHGFAAVVGPGRGAGVPRRLRHPRPGARTARRSGLLLRQQRLRGRLSERVVNARRDATTPVEEWY